MAVTRRLQRVGGVLGLTVLLVMAGVSAPSVVYARGRARSVPTPQPRPWVGIGSSPVTSSGLSTVPFIPVQNQNASTINLPAVGVRAATATLVMPGCRVLGAARFTGNPIAALKAAKLCATGISAITARGLTNGSVQQQPGLQAHSACRLLVGAGTGLLVAKPCAKAVVAATGTGSLNAVQFVGGVCVGIVGQAATQVCRLLPAVRTGR